MIKPDKLHERRRLIQRLKELEDELIQSGAIKRRVIRPRRQIDRRRPYLYNPD